MTDTLTIEELRIYHIDDPSVPIDDLIREYNDTPHIHPSMVYCIPLLMYVDLYLADRDTIYSMICRCVEYNLERQLLYILSHDIDCDKDLMLRYIGSPYIYSIAQQYGYRDIELDKRIVWLQRRFRLGKNDIYHRYEGPNIVEYYRDNRYYGYRRAIHRMRWDRRNRDIFYQDIINVGAYGNCEWEAYMDYMGK